MIFSTVTRAIIGLLTVNNPLFFHKIVEMERSPIWAVILVTKMYRGGGPRGLIYSFSQG